MEKKDIYKHLAKIYLDASLKRRKKKKPHLTVFKNLIFIGIAFIFGLSVFFFVHLKGKPPFSHEVSLVLAPDVVKINFHFDPARKEIYYLGLNQLDLTRYKTLGFSLKTNSLKEDIALRVEFTSAFKEKSEFYIRALKNKWQDYSIKLSDFQKISDWSNMAALSFIVEEWNVGEKKSIVYLDNIRVLK